MMLWSACSGRVETKEDIIVIEKINPDHVNKTTDNTFGESIDVPILFILIN